MRFVASDGCLGPADGYDRAVRSGAGSSTTEPHRRALDRLRRDLTPTLDALDRAAADPWGLEEQAEDLPALQYALHAASERVRGIDYGIRPDAGYEALELALAVAREETADLAEILDQAGPFAAGTLVWEWRVALFAVRLALRDLEQPGFTPDPKPSQRREAVPLALLGAGVATVLGGALGSLWPVWVLGLALVAVSTARSHRLP